MQDLSGSWCIKGTDKSTLAVDSSVPLMHHDQSNLCIFFATKNQSPSNRKGDFQ